MSFKLLPLILLISLIWGGACLNPIPQGTLTSKGPGTIHGAIVDHCQPSAGIAGVQVLALRLLEGIPRETRSVFTDQHGTFILEDLPEGEYIIRAILTDYKVGEQVVQLTAGETQQLQISLAPELIEMPPSLQMDLLFVIDNSASMEQEQLNLVEGFPAFITEFIESPIPQLDLQFGVISGDLGAGNFGHQTCEVIGGDRGELQNQPRTAGCQPPVEAFIQIHRTSAGETLQSNVPGNDYRAAFSCIAQLGIGGCGFEQPLLAIKQALDPAVYTNPGFLRSDSFLAIVVISDEDDCSAVDPVLFDPTSQGMTDPLGPLSSFRCTEFGLTCAEGMRTPGLKSSCVPATGGYLYDVQEFITWLEALQPRGTFFSVIGGPPNLVAVGLEDGKPSLKPSCQSASGFAVPAVRLNHVVTALSPRSSMDTLCATSLETTLRSLAQKIINSAILDTCN